VEAAKAMPYVKDVFSRVKSGMKVTFPENNVSKCGNVISAAPERETAINAAESAARSILIRLKAPNEQTAAFLAVPPSSQPAFPPDAFAAGKELLSLLAALPETDIAGIAEKELSLFPFPEFYGSGLLDWAGRSVEETLDTISALTGLGLNKGNKAPFLGRSFWQAFIRGGYQGAVYYIDCVISGIGLWKS
jgi:hypothetical protein